MSTGDEDLVFPGRAGVLTGRQVDRDWRGLAEQAGLTGFIPYSMRHGYKAALRRLGVSTDDISDLMGQLVNGSVTASVYGISVEPYVLTIGADTMDAEFTEEVPAELSAQH